MKKILYILFLLPVFCRGQNIKLPIDSDTKKITYQEVVHVDSASKDELYLRAREWFARNFVSSKPRIPFINRLNSAKIKKGKCIYEVMLYSCHGSWFAVFCHSK